MINFFLDQHGCAKNQIDAEIIITHLLKKGLKQCENPEDANIILINSCGFIESAKQESLEAVLNAKAAYPNAKILLTGCLAERYAENFSTELPEADGIMGNGNLEIIDSVVDELLQNKRPIEKPEQIGVCCGDRQELLSFPGSAYVKITEGCDNRCSFCAIPIIRGKLRSRPINEILDEIKSLLKRGIFEINLVGQDSAAYGMEGFSPHDPSVWQQFNLEQDASNEKTKISPLANLLKEISKLDGEFWLRILYIHPDHFPLDILPIIAQDKRLLPYFDIPFQSGADEIIKSMNRIGNAATYINLVEKIRKSQKTSYYGSIALRTTFLTGFPGETNKNAKETEVFLKSISPDWSGCFNYSKEDDTIAASMKKQIPSKIAKKRSDKLQNIQSEITALQLQKRVGNICSVLVEEIIEGGDGEGTGLAIGRAWFQAPEVDGAVVIRYEVEQANLIIPGKTIQVRLSGTSGVDLTGDLLC
ncbi:MAG: 30S ribosomal protein S12 methylthiotransferase RimO [Spirochaetaceae bacterium]|nr:30S ribosomal protein S12 methylthiotransferase RimO [Spirochaetaceae bacterium]